MAMTTAEGVIDEVPLVFDMATPAWTPLQTAAVEVAIVWISTIAAIRFLDFVTGRFSEVSWTSELAPDSRVKRQRTVTSAMLDVLAPPLRTYLPIYALLHSIRVLTSRLSETMNLCSTCARNSLERRMESVLDAFLRILTPIDQIVAAILRQAFLFVVVWFLVTAKNQYVTYKIEQRARSNPSQLQDFKRMVLPLSDILSWVIVGLGLMTGLGMAGVDIRPLITIGGSGAIVIGIAAQSVMANMIAGINLFLSRPFVRGDRIQLFDFRGTVMYNGTIERVNPLRTVIRTDKNYPLTLPNKILADMVIGNESRFPTSPVLQVEGSRRIQVALTFGLDYFEKLDDVIASMTRVLEEFESINRGLPLSVTVGALTDADVTLDLQATTLKRESVKFGEVRVALMRVLRKALKQNGIEEYKLAF